MNNKLEKYANLLINRCLSIKKNQPLLIAAPIEAIEFIRIVTTKALEAGVKDIYYDFDDEYLKHEQLKYLSDEELKNSRFFNKKIFDEYAKKGAAFLMLCADNSETMKDIEKDKISSAAKISATTKPKYKKMQLNNEIPWCIACIATDTWAKKVLPNSKNPKEELWNLIFEMCLINKKDPIKEWDNKIKSSDERIKKINELNIKKLYYKNKLGTDFVIEFNNNIWCGAGEHTKDGTPLIVNMPTEEVFTTPNKYSANGIVYASKPLIYNGCVIDDFWIEFKDGKVKDYDAKKGKDILKTIFEFKNGDYLGEVALVDVSSPISKSNILFYDTLYDENASCHLALGQGFKSCFKTTKNLEKLGFNDSKTHVDFMIGTDDLEIVAETIDNKQIKIMENGKFKI